MFVRRRVPFLTLAYLALAPSLLSAGWTAVIFVLYVYAGWTFLKLPFLPVATLGTAVAFYVGFKNNAAYDRFWEGRKIWGGIVNASRSWASAVIAYVGTANDQDTHRRLVYRQLAWINALRLQLRKTSRFYGTAGRSTRRRLSHHDAAMRNDWDREVAPFLDPEEHQTMKTQVNAASQLLRIQSEELAQLQRQGKLDVFLQVDLMQLVREFYALQGKCERIKNTPLPRQYAEFGRWFTRAFILLLPCGLLSVFADHLHAFSSNLERAELMLPLFVSAAMIGWVYFTMDAVGDASEDPFERSMNDVPMNALCVTIERDLRQMLGETELPPPETPIDDILY